MQTKKYSEISRQEWKTYTGIVIYESGTKHWLFNGKLHRTDGPAIEYPDGYKKWYLHGQLHRTDGPAVECADDWYKGWWYYGQSIDVKSQEEFEKYLITLAFE